MGWLNRIIERIMAFFPQIIQLPPFTAGVRFTFGKYAKAKRPGWYLVWPLIQKFIWMEVQTQVVDLRTQSVTTSDNKDIVISGAIQYSIRDIKKAVCLVQNVDVSLEILALGIILEFVNTKTLKECQNVKALKAEILKGMREAVNAWGVKLERVYMTDLGHTRNIRLLTNPVPVLE